MSSRSLSPSAIVCADGAGRGLLHRIPRRLHGAGHHHHRRRVGGHAGVLVRVVAAAGAAIARPRAPRLEGGGARSQALGRGQRLGLEWGDERNLQMQTSPSEGARAYLV